MEKIKLELYLDKEIYAESLKQYDSIKEAMISKDGEFTYQKYLEYLVTTFVKGNKQMLNAKDKLGGFLENFKDQLGGLDLDESIKNFDMESFLNFFKTTEKKDKPKEEKKIPEQKLKS